MIQILRPDTPFPPVADALPADSPASGLLAAGGDLEVERLKQAYTLGIFPWYSASQPILWWSPDPRMVLYVDEFKVSRSLRKTLMRFIASPHGKVTIDTEFRQVITACAGTPRAGQPGSWIVPDMVEAYCQLHRAGLAHSFETWVNGEMVGGLYGVSLGRMFYGESMFARATDASKIALAALVAFCRTQGIAMIDCQQNTAHLASLGAREIPRAEFVRHLEKTTGLPPVQAWDYDQTSWDSLRLNP